MTLQEIKTNILNNTLSNDFLIFKYKNNKYIPEEYIAEICSRKGYLKNKINSLFDVTESALSLIIDYTENLNVLDVEKFAEKAENYNDLENIIVLCKSIDPKIEPLVKNFIVEVPDLEDWQVLAEMQQRCPGLDDEDYEWLYNAANKDIYRIHNELDKLTLFDESERTIKLHEIKNAKGTDLFNIGFLDISNAIKNKDKMVLFNYLKHQSNINIDPFGIVNILINHYKLLAYIKGSNATAQELGISDKQYYVVKNNATRTADKTIFNALQFLVDIDYRLKDNRFEADPNTVISYVICKLFAM